MIELDRHIEILLLGNDCVIIPGFGGFMAHYVEARKDERDNAFLPPMRAVGFNPKLVLNDSLLAQSYVEAYDISYPDAVGRIEDEVRELRQHLANSGQYELRHIGVLRLNGYGGYDFEPCSAGILTPELYGLGYVECKTLEQLDREAAAAMGEALPAHVASEELPQDEKARVVEMEEPDTEHRSVSLWRNIAVACVAFVVFLLIPAPLANNSPQLMQGKLNTQLLQYVMPKDVTVGSERVEQVVREAGKAAAKAGEPQAAAVMDEPREGYVIVLASRVSRKNAEAYVAALRERGYGEARVHATKRNTKVVYGHYDTQNEAYKALGKLNDEKEFAEAWVMKY